MKKKLLMMMLAVMLLLDGCGNADNKDTEADTQQTESQSTSETETLEANTEEETTTEVVNTEVESETPTQTESETPQPSEEPSEPQAPQYTYTDLNKTMYAKSSVNVRSLPSTDGEKLGGLSKGQEVAVSGQCNETGWYRIEFNGGTGYVSSSYLVDEKPVEETPAENPYPLYQIIDEGGTNVYFYWLYDGTAMKPAEYWTCADECFYILMDRNGWDRSLLYNGVGTGVNVEWTDYYVDGKRVAKALPLVYQ